jgi:hypothetical protein
VTADRQRPSGTARVYWEPGTDPVGAFVAGGPDRPSADAVDLTDPGELVEHLFGRDRGRPAPVPTHAQLYPGVAARQARLIAADEPPAPASSCQNCLEIDLGSCMTHETAATASPPPARPARAKHRPPAGPLTAVLARFGLRGGGRA